MSEDGVQTNPTPTEGTACLALALCLLPFHTADKRIKEKRLKLQI